MDDECRVPVHDLHWVSKDKDFNSTGKIGEGMSQIVSEVLVCHILVNTLVTYKLHTIFCSNIVRYKSPLRIVI